MKKIACLSAIMVVYLLVTAGYGEEKAKPARHTAKVSFSGTVSDVNVLSSTISVRDRGNIVTFDASNPVFSGYRGITEVRRGDRVAISYTVDGIRIKRLTGKAALEAKEGPPAAPGKRSKDTGKLQRRDRRGNGTAFDDVDANKDGSITPVELSLLINNITMDQFRQYDKNGDGRLDKTEFLNMIRQQRSVKEK